VILRGGSPEDPPRRGHRPASPRALHVTHLALGARDPPGRPSPEDPPQAWPPAGPPGPFTPLTWRRDQVAPLVAIAPPSSRRRERRAHSFFSSAGDFATSLLLPLLAFSFLRMRIFPITVTG